MGFAFGMRLEIAGFMRCGEGGPIADDLVAADLGTGYRYSVERTITLDEPTAPVLAAAINGIGKPEGVRASRMLAELLIEGFSGAPAGGTEEDWRRRITAVLEGANGRMYDAGFRSREGLGAELTLAIVDGAVMVATVGGSTAGYRLRRGAVVQVTCFDGGCSAAPDREACRLTRHDCIGSFESMPMEGDLHALAPRRGDIFLLCTGDAMVGAGQKDLLDPRKPDGARHDPALIARAVVELDPNPFMDASCLALRVSGDDLPEPDPGEPPLRWRTRAEGLPLFGGYG